MTEVINTSLTSTNYEDLLDRRKLAKNFLSVVLSQPANVYSINAPWGAGKSWFLKFIEDECSEHQIPFIQFNVWETDYANNPFIAIMSEIISLIKRTIQNIDEKNDIYVEIEQIRTTAEKISLFLKRLSGGVGYTIVDPNLPTNSYNLNLQLNPEAHTQLKEYEELKSLKEQLFRLLNKLPSLCKKEKLIIAIDELDRCRPDYAITTLEIIKHFFNINNVVFILAVDKEQLYCTVKTMFGATTDVDAYLKKFVDIQYCLPDSHSVNNFIQYQIKTNHSKIQESFNKLSEYALSQYEGGSWYCRHVEEDVYFNEFSNLCIKYKLSLRDIEKLCLSMNIILPLIVENKIPFSLTFLVVLILLNTKHHKTYLCFKNVAPLAGNADYAGRLYWVENKFSSTYRKIYQVLNSKMERRYNSEDDLFAQHLMEYFNFIDFAKDFTNA